MAYYAPFYRQNYYDQMQTAQNMNPYTQQYQQPMQTIQTPMQQPAQPPQNNNGLIWVQGESGAKSYMVAPNNTVMLMDAENSTFYLKSADASGMPLPLRIFDYKERSVVGSQPVSSPTIENSINYDNFVTREEFERRLASIASNGSVKNNLMEDVEDGKSLV